MKTIVLTASLLLTSVATAGISGTPGVMTMLPEGDRVVQVIAKAGSSGVARRDLIGQINLPWRLLDDLLQQMVQIGIISVANDARGPVYRLAKAMFGVFDV